MFRSGLRILIIRRDNIGDLVCTTPLIRALRQHFPDAYIAALVNSYNRAVLDDNPDVDEVYSYTKAKHRPTGRSLASVYLDRLKTIWTLRRQMFDYAILAAPGFQKRALRYARLIRPKHVVGFTPPGRRVPHIDIGVPYAPSRPNHEVEDTFCLAAALGIEASPGAVRVYPAANALDRARSKVSNSLLPAGRLLIGIHISARKPSQRWPAERFVQLMRALHGQYQARFVLFWAPGRADNRLHAGDDEKAGDLIGSADNLPLLPYPTSELADLIAGLSLCDLVICSDGGAMHLAAGLGKPILCFFGKSSLSRWHPWGVPYVAIQPPSRDVGDISVEDALDGWRSLLKKAGTQLQD